MVCSVLGNEWDGACFLSLLSLALAFTSTPKNIKVKTHPHSLVFFATIFARAQNIIINMIYVPALCGVVVFVWWEILTIPVRRERPALHGPDHTTPRSPQRERWIYFADALIFKSPEPGLSQA